MKDIKDLLSFIKIELWVIAVILATILGALVAK